MRREDAKMLSERLTKILQQHPDVCKEAAKYFENRKKMTISMISEPEEFANSYWVNLADYIVNNAHVKGLVVEFLKLIDVSRNLKGLALIAIKGYLERGEVTDALYLINNNLNANFGFDFKTEDNEDNNENNGH